MCGICGQIDFSGRPVDRETLQAMADALAHRGPDGDGFHLSPALNQPAACGLAHRRLAIIDLDGGAQPLSNEDESLWMVVNGEFYGYRSTRQELIEAGHQFKTESDSEVLLHLYEDMGEAALKRLNGMFALALWDRRRGKLILARDRMGQKPLYYTQVGQRVLFGSEVKSLLADPEFQPRFDPTHLAGYLTWLYLPGDRSLIEGVHQVQPGHLVRFKLGRPGANRTGVTESEAYWTPPKYEPTPMELPEALAEFERLLTEAVATRLVADVPVGAFLSGGVDSSVICALMSKLDQETKTFTVSFGQASFDESAQAEKMAAHLGTDHTTVPVEPNVLEAIENLIYCLDQPMADSSAIPTYWLCQATRRNVTVALSGDAGDELLAGYRRYLGRRLAEMYNHLPGFIRSALKAGAGLAPESTAYLAKNPVKQVKMFLEQAHQAKINPAGSRIDFTGPAERAQLISLDCLGRCQDPAAIMAGYFQGLEDVDPVSRMQMVDLVTYLPDDILVKVDRMSMAHALEVRSPFLDHHLVEFLATVPVELKLRGLTTKFLLKRLALKYIPEEAVQRPKQGFEVPLAAWFKTDLKTMLADVLTKPELEHRGLLNPGAVAGLIEEHQTGRRDRAQLLWALLVLELWIKRFNVSLG